MKIQAPGYIRQGRLEIKNRPALAANVSAIKDCDVFIIIDTDTRVKTKEQRGYYWSTLVPHTLIILSGEIRRKQMHMNFLNTSLILCMCQIQKQAN